MELKEIGIIHTPYEKKEDAPSQGRYSEEKSEILVHGSYVDGLKDIESCSHLIVLYWQDRSDRNSLKARPPHGKKERGVFATRSPNRPNPIGFCIAELCKIEGNRLLVKGLDALDKSPLLDIKPYSPDIDCIPEAKIGWQDQSEKE